MITSEQTANTNTLDITNAKVPPEDDAIPQKTPNRNTNQTIAKINHAEELKITLQELHTQRRKLLRQIHTVLNGPGPDPTTRTFLPSMAAHTVPNPPLTPAQEKEAEAKAKGAIKEHISLLHRYNEIRDVGQGLIGMVADSRRVRVRDCQEEFGVTDGD